MPTATHDFDWSFRSSAPEQIHSIHPYPARFIPEIPRELIVRFAPPPRTIVVDPFCGSGTTLVEAQAAGYRAAGIDLNPIACLISRVKTRPRAENLLADCARVVARAQGARAKVPQIPALSHWFKKDISAALANLRCEIDNAPSASRDALKLAFSRIIVRVSNQESDTRYASVVKDVSASGVLEEFARAVAVIDKVLLRRPLSQVAVYRHNALTFDYGRLRSKIGLIVCSPPYPNAYEYWLYHKYRMWWLGFDPLAVKAEEIGARAHFFRKDPHTADTFRDQIGQFFANVRDNVVPGGHACFIIGTSRIHGKIIDNAQIISACAAQSGFVKVLEAERDLLATRKAFNLSHARLKKEKVLVLRRRK